MKRTKTEHVLRAIAGGESRTATYLTAMSSLDSGTMQVQDIALKNIEGSQNNFFAVKDVQDLADSIALIGLQQPLVVTAEAAGVDGEMRYLLIAGHRRRKALLQLGKTFAPCVIVQPAADELEELALIQTNTTSRSLSYPERMEAVRRTETALVALKEKGYDLPGSMRDRVAEITKEKAAEIARMKVIDKNLSQPLREYLTADKINASTAYALARLDDEGQAHFAEKIAADEWVGAYSIDKYRERQENSDWILDKCPCAQSAASASCTSYETVRDCRKEGKDAICCHTCLEFASGCKKACYSARSYKSPEERAEQEAARAEEHARYLQTWRSFPGNVLPQRLHGLIRARGLDAEALEKEICEAYGTDEWEFPSWGLIPDEDTDDADDMPNACQVAALCRHLEVSADYLLGLSDVPEPAAGWYRMQDAAPHEGEVVLAADANGNYRRARWGEGGGWYHPDVDDIPLKLGATYWTRNYPGCAE